MTFLPNQVAPFFMMYTPTLFPIFSIVKSFYICQIFRHFVNQHCTFRRISHIPNIHIANILYPNIQTFHIRKIQHTKHLTSQVFYFQNTLNTEQPRYRTSHIPNILLLEHPISQIAR